MKIVKVKGGKIWQFVTRGSGCLSIMMIVYLYSIDQMQWCPSMLSIGGDDLPILPKNGLF